MAGKVSEPCQGCCAAWPIARNSFVWGAEDASRMARARWGEGRGLTGEIPPEKFGYPARIVSL
jgi:hypothetical protein